MQLQDETRDGLRVFSVDSGRATSRATLFFRVGQADETLPTCGWTHLLEHLALHDWNDPRLAFNASVGLFTTRFDLDGETDAVFEHLERLFRWLAAPDLSNLEHEARVLVAESEQRPVPAVVTNLEWRFGARGPGLPAYRELGLTRACEDGLTGWAASVFTAGNAALAIDTPLPSTFAVALPPGSYRRAPMHSPVTSTVPGYHRVVGGVVGSAIVPRSDAATLAAETLRRTLTSELRTDAGAAYAPWAENEPVNSDSGLLMFGSDVSHAGHLDVGGRVGDILTRLARTGPSQQVLDEMRIVRERHLSDPVNAPLIAWHAALQVMSDAATIALDEQVARVGAVAPADLAEVFETVQRSLVIGLPVGSTTPFGVAELRHPQTHIDRSVESFRHVDGRTTIHVTDFGMQLASPQAVVTTRWQDVAGLVTYPDGARIVVSRAGWQMAIEPTLLRRGTDLVELIDRAVPDGLVLPQTARSPDDVPIRPTLVQRARFRTHAKFTYAGAYVRALFTTPDFYVLVVGVLVLVSMMVMQLLD